MRRTLLPIVLAFLVALSGLASPTTRAQEGPWGAQGPLYPAEGANGLYGYASQGDVMVIDSVFMAANPFGADGTAWVILGEAYGRIDVHGRWARPPEAWFARVSDSFPNGLAEAEDALGNIGFIDGEGHWAIGPGFRRSRGFSGNGLAAVMTGEGKWGFIDGEGRFAIEAEFLDARPFAPNGLALVKSPQGLFGYVDQNGRFAIEPRFREARSFGRNGLAAAMPEGEELFGLIDQSGALVVAPSFGQAAGPSSNDLVAVSDPDGLWGFADALGQWAIGPKYQRVSPFGANGLARFRLEDGSMGLLNELDQWVLEPQFAYLGDFSAQGRPTEFTPAHSLDGSWGLINRSGEWVAMPGQGQCVLRLDGLLAVREADGPGWAYYNLRGQRRVPLGYDRQADPEPPGPGRRGWRQRGPGGHVP
ncbi:MAG: WG repeat-containing protein [Deltaproteobacteria bacterium]|nr:WG repeat-containing protein [Deltaproteobacteria bacterium]